jgi:hydrogenase expression/formation protein HypE
MLIDRLFMPAFSNAALDSRHDGAILAVNGARLAFTTDSYVVTPIEFPGGDIASMAVHGTINDLAMCGATPLGLSAAFILEEGLPMETLWRLTRSMQRAAEAAAVSILTGDTKVVNRGKGDGLYITTSGVGMIAPNIDIDPRRAQPGDLILVSGDIATHGIAILSVREGLEFETTILSDSAPLHTLTAAILETAGPLVHVLRDPTRGGVASALNEIAETAHVGMTLQESTIPIQDEVRGACELLGLDPLYVANEGKLIAIVNAEAADSVLEAMRRHPLGRNAAIIGTVTADHPGHVFLRSRIGGLRVVDMLSGEQLPRIC